MSVQDAYSAITSALAALGVFDRVASAEPKSPPGKGVYCAVYIDTIDPDGSVSGLSQPSGIYMFRARIYRPALEEPQERIDPLIIAATDAVISALAGDFDLGGNARNVDFYGQASDGVHCEADYIKLDDKVYRTMDVLIPVIVDNAWSAFNA